MQVVCGNCQLSFQAPEGAAGLMCPICRSPLRPAQAGHRLDFARAGVTQKFRRYSGHGRGHGFHGQLPAVNRAFSLFLNHADNITRQRILDYFLSVTILRFIVTVFD